MRENVACGEQKKGRGTVKSAGNEGGPDHATVPFSDHYAIAGVSEGAVLVRQDYQEPLKVLSIRIKTAAGHRSDVKVDFDEVLCSVFAGKINPRRSHRPAHEQAARINPGPDV